MSAQREPKVGRRPGNQDTRGQIITAARQAFAAKGFAGASMRAIATDAGVDAALIHHYFDSKQQLFLATVALPLELPRIVEEVAAGDRNDLGERLVQPGPIDVPGGHTESLLRGAYGGRAADAAGRSGDDGDTHGRRQ